MMSSALYPKLDPAAPAVLSRAVVTGLLQQRLGFSGVVMTDDIGAAAALRAIPVGQRGVRFIAAGGHLVLSVRTSDAGPLSRAAGGPGASRIRCFRRQVDSAAARVVQSKVDAGLVTCSR
jgi:beta-N-acetylhexosaminidase